MALTLEQYAAWLASRPLLWPAPPEIRPPKVHPRVVELPPVRFVSFSVYGTLLAVGAPGLYLEHPDPLVMQSALEKTIQEFKMWPAMARKPGAPWQYLLERYRYYLEQAQTGPAGPYGPHAPREVRSDSVWAHVIDLLLKNEYRYDSEFYGTVGEFGQKLAYFFHSNLQGSQAFPGALHTLRELLSRGIELGLVADGQCFTRVQLLRGLQEQGKLQNLAELWETGSIVLSYEVGVRKPAEQLYEHLMAYLHNRGLKASEVLHVSSRLSTDIAVAKRIGMRTALFAADKASLEATPEQLRQLPLQPDLLLNDLTQLQEAVKGVPRG